MGNLATGAFERPIPLPLVKSIEILSSEDNDAMTHLKIDLSLQVAKAEEGRAFGLFIALINDGKTLERLKEKEGALRYEIANRNSAATKSAMIKKYIGIEDFVTEGKLKHIINNDSGIGVITREVPLDIEIYLKEEQNLWLYCVAYELDSEASGLNKAGVPENKKFELGPPVVETIMKRGKPSSTTSLFILDEAVDGVGEEGEVWAGPVHLQGSSYIAGQRPGEKESAKLKRVKVSNQKVRDLRLLKDIENFDLDNFVVNAKNINKTNVRNFERVRDMVGKRYFARMYYSRNTTGEFKLWMAMDYDAFINDHCRLANVFTNKASLRSCYSVDNVTVFRQKRARHDEGSKLASQLTAESQTKVLEPVVRIADLKKGNIVAFDTANDNFINFLINDVQMEDSEINIYEYTVHFEFIDRTALVVQKIVDRLRDDFTSFQSFLSNFEGLGKKNFDTQEYLRVNAKVIKSDDSWLNLINEFLASVWFLFGKTGFGNQSPVLWKKNLTTMVNPNSATEESLRKFTEMIQEYINDLRYLVSASPVGRSAAKFSARSKISRGGNLIKRIKYTHTPRRVRKRSENNVGFDYLGVGIHAVESHRALTTFDYDALVKRLNVELRKYQVGNPNVTEINKFGFLSPYNLYTPYEVQSTNRAGLELSDGLVILDNRVNPGINLFAADGAIADLDVKLAKMQGIHGSAGITVAPLREGLNSYIEARKRPASDQKQVPALDYLDPDGFPFEITGKESAVSGSQEAQFFHLQGDRALIRALEGPLSEQLLDGVAQNFIPPQPTNVRAVKGSLALARVHQNVDEFLNLNSFERDINYNSLRKIEFLDGYRGKDIRRPRWSILTEGRLKEMREEGSTVMCRLRRCPPMTSPGNAYELSSFNYLFVIGVDLFENAQIIKANYRSRYNRYLQRLARLDKSSVTNINRPEANYGSEYYSSDAMVFKVVVPILPPLTPLQVAQNEWDAKKKAWRGRGWNWRSAWALRRFAKIYGPRPVAGGDFVGDQLGADNDAGGTGGY
tara:strand:- start:107 stop:3157 length:3051 start_codon:yes stop_codon:yes gene_type:complete